MLKKNFTATRKEPIVSPIASGVDLKVIEETLRPRKLEEYIGQDQIKENLSISIQAAKSRGEPLEHLIFYGPPGIGKTTLANIVASEMGVSIRTTSGPAIEKQGDLAALLTNLKENDVLFIDEIHRLKTAAEEILYSAMEDFKLDLIIGKGPGARSMRLNLPKFTLVAATTKIAQLSSPLRDRFGHLVKIDFYTELDIQKIILRSARILECEIEVDAAAEIARRARKTPRIANRLLKRVRDFAAVKQQMRIDLTIVKTALEALGVDELGLDSADRKILETLIQKFDGGPVGLNTLAAATAEEEETIEDVYEPYLLQLGFLERTPRGRKATPRGYSHLGISVQIDRPLTPSLF